MEGAVYSGIFPSITSITFRQVVMALINYITQIQFDFGAVRLVASECERLGIRCPLIVTDAGICAAGLLDKVLDALGSSSPVPVSDATPPNEAAVREAVGMFKGNTCDGVIAVGGGSSDRSGQGRGRLRDARRAARELCGDRRRTGAHHGEDGAGHRHSDDGGHGQRSRARRDPDSRRWPQGRRDFAARGAESRHLRSRTHARPAAYAQRRDRHGRHRALSGDVHGARVQRARPTTSRSTACGARGVTSNGRRATARTASRAGT